MSIGMPEKLCSTGDASFVNATFGSVGSQLGSSFTRPNVGRGLAVADYDNDGDLDFFVVNSNRRAELFRNEGGNTPSLGGGNWLILDLVGTRSNRDDIGARARLMPADPDGEGAWQVEEVKAGSSYLSQNDTPLHFGLALATSASRVEVLWPSGITQVLEDVAACQILTIVEQAP